MRTKWRTKSGIVHASEQRDAYVMLCGQYRDTCSFSSNKWKKVNVEVTCKSCLKKLAKKKKGAKSSKDRTWRSWLR